ncbi:MAG TPA: AAA family ATPase [Thermoleophilaceae bacterium]|nr:AAA family ATPase [Thermoleophilaceae bacterium]
MTQIAPSRVPLLEREAEFEALSDALTSARAGSGRLLLIEGPPGIGKSTLLDVTKGRAADAGFLVLSAESDELEAGFPFGIAIHLLEPALRRDDAPDEVFDGPAALAASLFGPSDETASEPAGDASFARIHGLTWLCANLSARGPLLLAVDDAHWADTPSLVWLRYLARRLEALPLLLAVATRTGEPDRGQEALRGMASAAFTRVLRPPPLSEPAGIALARSVLGDETSSEFARACHRAAGGNPFFLRELLAGIAEGPPEGAADRVADMVPSSVSEAVAARLARLDSASQRLARAIAVLGDAVPLHQAAAVAEIDVPEAARAADTLAAAGLLRTELPAGFAHPLLRASVQAGLGVGARALLHRSAAQVLARERAKPELVAAHLLQSEPEGAAWAVDALWDSARRAVANGAPAAAAQYLGRALAEGATHVSRGELLLALGQAQIDAGDPASIETLEEATRAEGDADAVEAYRELGRALAVFGRLDDAAVAFDSASGAAGDDRRDARLEVEAELASIQLTLKGMSGVRERLAPHREGLTGRSGGERLLMAVAAYADAQANVPCDATARLAAQALDGWDEHALRSASLCFYGAIFALIYADRYDIADAALAEALRDARERGSPTALANAAWLRAWIHLRCGRLAEAEAEAGSAPGLESDEAGAGGPLLQSVVVEALVQRGELAAAEAILGDLADGEIPTILVFNALLYSRGLLRLARGRLGDGLADLLGAGGEEISPAAFPWRSTAALAHRALGEREEASRRAAEELRLAREFGAPRALGIALTAFGVVEGDIDHLREAVAVLERSPAQLEFARAQLELGAALRRSGSRRLARDPLRAALDIARRCGAVPLAERAHEELAASGARPRRSALSGREALTPSELRVARLAAEGSNNREIAQDLFITVRTVEGHLSRTYAKLEIGSRDQLAAALDSGA